MLVIGIGIGFILTSILDNYLRKKGLILNYKFLAIIILGLWFIYSFVGFFLGTEYAKDNGNVCKGFEYGIQVCHGDINAE